MPQVTRIDPVFGLVGEHKLKVCAYCRVSSSSEDQLNSFAVQVKYYTKYIESHAEWELVDIFADEGITGTCADKRTEFMRMLQLCKHRKIDLILTKSISRFARNVPECLDFARKLRRQGVGIIFEKEAINTLRMSDELMLSTFSAIAQEESMAISQRLRHMNHERMKRGEYIAGLVPYGFVMNADKQLVVVDEEAEVIRKIFQDYLSGVSMRDIAEELERLQISRPRTEKKWSYLAIRYILSNEKYVGDTLFQKTYKTETLPFRKKYNYGEKPQYYVEHTHTGIISREVFDSAQNLIQSHAGKTAGRSKNAPYPLTRKIRCSECGSYYIHKTTASGAIWQCKKHYLSASNCPSRRYPENILYEAFIRMFNKLQYNSKTILRSAILQLSYVMDRKKHGDMEIVKINQKIAVLLEKKYALQQLRSKGYLQESVFQKQCREIDSQIQLAKKDRDILYDDTLEQTYSDAKKTLKIIEDYKGELKSFDEKLFDMLVEDAEISPDGVLTFRLPGGFKFSERLLP